MAFRSQGSLQQEPFSAYRDRTAAPLHIRLLFPHLPLGEPVPQLVQGDSVDIRRLNERLYHLIALALRAYILSWYTRFSRDRSLLPSINSTVIQPVLAPIFNRIHDKPEVVSAWALIDFPTLISTHVRTYWEARAAQEVCGTKTTVAQAYHARLPLLSVSPSSDASEFTLSPIYLTALSDALIASDQPDVQRLMIREVIARAVLAGGLRRLCFGWFWYGLLLRFMGEPGDPAPWRRKDAPDTLKSEQRSLDSLVLSYVTTFYSILTAIYSSVLSIVTFYTASPAPSPEYYHCAEPVLKMVRELLGVDGYGGIAPKNWARRLVWAGVELSVDLCSPVIDRIAPLLVQRHLTPDLAFRLIDLTERLLFPLDGYPGPSPIDPTPQEAEEIKARAETRLGEIIPQPLKTLFFPVRKDVERLLEPLSDAGCNAHLMGMILDGLVGLLVPDLVLEDGG